MKGDISNQVVPVLILVFEGALGKLASEDEKTFEKAYRRKQWKKAVDLWDINEPLCWQMMRVVMSNKNSIEVVTFIGQDQDEYVECLEDRLQNKEDLPVRRVWATEPHLLARKVTMRNDVAAVYDPDPARRFTYGGKGRVLQRIAQFGA